MPAARLELAPATATFGTSLGISVGTPIWLHWLRIGRDQTALARKAADKAPAGNVADEMYPAMIAITATAHALDGLYDQIRLYVPKRPKGRPARQRLILETIKQCFLVGTDQQRWLELFDWLDALRDPAVHPEHKAGPALAHPSGWVGNVAAEYVEYSAANAEKALALLEDVLRTCVAKPRPTVP